MLASNCSQVAGERIRGIVGTFADFWGGSHGCVDHDAVAQDGTGKSD